VRGFVFPASRTQHRDHDRPAVVALQASYTRWIAHSHNSCGYFLGAGKIPSVGRSHQTRGRFKRHVGGPDGETLFGIWQLVRAGAGERNDPAGPDGSVAPPGVAEHARLPFLAAFVARNTIMYVALAVAKMLPKVYLSNQLN
jgi:hypothetical protein